MSLSDLASLGSFVSGVAVLASLVFLFFQMRQMTEQVRQSEKNQQAAIRQGRSSRAVDIVLRGTDPGYAEVSIKVMSGSEDAPSVAQFTAYWRATFFNWEDAFYQHLEGLLSELAFSALAHNVKAVMETIPQRAQWRLWRYQYGTEFVAWVDKLVAQTPKREAGSLAT